MFVRLFQATLFAACAFMSGQDHSGFGWKGFQVFWWAMAMLTMPLFAIELHKLAQKWGERREQAKSAKG